LPDRNQIKIFGEHIVTFLKKLNRMAQIAPLRKALHLFGKDELERYHKRYYRRIEELIRNWEHIKKICCLGCPSLILVGATEAATCPQEDAMLAPKTSYWHHAMGLGTCLIGFAGFGANPRPVNWQVPGDGTRREHLFSHCRRLAG